MWDICRAALAKLQNGDDSFLKSDYFSSNVPFQ